MRCRNKLLTCLSMVPPEDLTERFLEFQHFSGHSEVKPSASESLKMKEIEVETTLYSDLCLAFSPTSPSLPNLVRQLWRVFLAFLLHKGSSWPLQSPNSTAGFSMIESYCTDVSVRHFHDDQVVIKAHLAALASFLSRTPYPITVNGAQECLPPTGAPAIFKHCFLLFL